ncbi:MAG: prepilin-type N-terminal cleavage/methylation domain-containing protein [Planctomycetales bacterium]|nr:prepilin-type N-terminal cleavage/methylation domain-containing protein [Planctomycetales bacterium]
MNRHQGFTLMELLLVLAILVVAGAVTIPVAIGPLEGQRLLKAGDQVRAAFNRARVAAMRTGQIHFFRFQPNSNQYAIEALADGESMVEASAEVMMQFNGAGGAGGLSGGLVAPGAGGGVGSVDPLTGQPQALTLPENTMFVSVSNLAELKSARVLERMQTMGDITLSEPILFYPDGTSSTTQLVLANPQEQFVVIRLRGLTGLAQLSGLLTSEEVPQ